MKGYAEASLFPQIDVEGVSIPRIIMGHLPFVGESYQGIKKNREYLERFSCVENIVKVLRKAVDHYGVTVVATAFEETSQTLFDAIRETMSITDTEIAIIPCFQIPLTIDGEPVDDYRRWLTYYRIERQIVGREIYEKYVKDPILLCREGWGKKFPQALRQLKPYSKRELQSVKIDYQILDEAVSRFRKFKVLLAEPGSESDFLAMTRRTDVLMELTTWLRDHLKCPVVIGTHHAGLTIPILEESDIAIAGYVTPVNMLGAMMFPNHRLAIEEIKRSKKKIIGIKPLAGGRIPPSEAFKYVYKKVSTDACMVGVASIQEVDEDLSMVKRVLGITVD